MIKIENQGNIYCQSSKNSIILVSCETHGLADNSFYCDISMCIKGKYLIVREQIW